MKEVTQHSLIQKYSCHKVSSSTWRLQCNTFKTALFTLPASPTSPSGILACELFPNPQKQKCLWSHKLYGISNPKSLFWGKYSALRPSRFPGPNTNATTEQRDRIHGWKFPASKGLEHWWRRPCPWQPSSNAHQNCCPNPSSCPQMMQRTHVSS